MPPADPDAYEQVRESLEGRPGGDALPAAMLDGYLCGVLLQPRAQPESRWWPPALCPDDDAVPAPSPALDELRAVARARHAELAAAIAARRWFDPWVIAESPAEGDPDDGIDPDTGEILDDGEMPGVMPAAVRDAVFPWVAGFAHAMACFDDLLELADPQAAEPQALLCQFLDPDDLEDADALLALIDTLEPPAELDEAVELLVRATLLLADITRPVRPAGGAPPHRAGPGGGRPGGGPGPRGSRGGPPRRPR
jgi:uncharacterized protein